MAGRSKISDEARARISRGVTRHWEKRRLRAKVRPRDLDRLARTGTVAPALLPLVAIARAEAEELGEALGQDLTPQRGLLVEDTAALGMILRAALAAFMQSDGFDGELASRIGTLVGQRRSSLTALGLERRAEEIDLAAYMAQRESAEDAAQATNADTPDAEPAAENTSAESDAEEVEPA